MTARFTLDAMPGKQMSIDAEMNAGIITEAQALEKRAKIQRMLTFMERWMVPVNLYGEMLLQVYL